MSEVDVWKRAWERERQAKLNAEQLLEDRSRLLYQKNTELEQSQQRLLSQQTTMLKNEKLATIGMLTAGVAHEVNNPLAVVLSNFQMLSEYNAQLIKLLECNKQWQAEGALSEEACEQLTALDKAYDFDYIKQDAPTLVEDMSEGLHRVKDIVSHMKRFSRTKPGEREVADINECIESSLKLVNNETKHHCTVSLDLGSIPNLSMNRSELSQVFMNLIINASHAVEALGQVRITTVLKGASVEVKISDNGCGMTEAIMSNIFNPFFTTKPPGQGTGMGLAVVHGIIQDHNGDIQVESELGKGSCFTISLPINEAAKES